MDEDIILINQFVGGEERGFEMLVKKYQNRALNIVYSVVGNDRDSEDILQEVFMKVYNSLRSFKQDAQFSTWLYRITVNTTYDFLRRRRHLVALEDIPQVNLVADNSQDSLHIKDRDYQIRKALESIPFKYRTAVVLKDIEGLSYQEIARVLGCSIGTVESRIFRARQLLKERLLHLEGEIR